MSSTIKNAWEMFNSLVIELDGRKVRVGVRWARQGMRFRGKPDRLKVTLEHVEPAEHEIQDGVDVLDSDPEYQEQILGACQAAIVKRDAELSNMRRSIRLS